MVPGACMQQLQLLGVGSILLTSGTLSPLASFADSFVRNAASFCQPYAPLDRILHFRSPWKTSTSLPHPKYECT